MFFNQPQMLHSVQEDGRHWITTMDVPPLQIWPVAPNLCRAGHMLARLVAARLAKRCPKLPGEITLTPKDFAAISGTRVGASKRKPAAVRIAVMMKPGPDSSGGGDTLAAVFAELGMGDVEYVTPQPVKGWKKDYDQWVVHILRTLGAEVPAPLAAGTYKRVLDEAIAKARKQIPKLRKHFLTGLDGLHLGFKLRLPTKKGKGEFVWLSVLDWSQPDVVKCRLENQPRSAKGFKLGQEMTVKVGDLVDYTIGSEKAGIVEPGFTQQVAEDYGETIA